MDWSLLTLWRLLLVTTWLANGDCLRWTLASGLRMGQCLDSAMAGKEGASSSRAVATPLPRPKTAGRPTDRLGRRSRLMGNRDFLDTFVRFRQALYPAGAELDAQLDEVVRQDSPLLPVVERRVKWLPVECKVMGIALGKSRPIVDEGPEKNAVFQVADLHHPRKVYAHKLFGKPADYTAELAFFMLADHPHIVKPVCIQREFRRSKSGGAGKGRAGIVMEFVAGKSSLDVAKDPATTPARLQQMTAQLLSVLKYVHRLGFVHADLKPDNVLVRPNGDIMLIDFGFAVPLPHQHPSRGNPYIKAPELNGLLHGTLNEALDMWAWTATVAIWHAYLYLPSYRRTGKKYTFLYNGRSTAWRIGAVPSKFPADLRALLYLGTALEVDQRRFQHQATYRFLQKMPFFASIDWERL